MAVPKLTRDEAVAIIEDAISYRNAALIGTLTIAQLQEGAERATGRAAAAKTGDEQSKYARRAHNNVMLVLALDPLGCDTCNEAITQLASDAADRLVAHVA